MVKRAFHDTDVWQRDFKIQQHFVRKWRLFHGGSRRSWESGVLSKRHKIYNLAQLNASVSNAITIKDRLRFYHYYATDHQLARPQRRAVYRQVWNITMTKKYRTLYDLFHWKIWINESSIAELDFSFMNLPILMYHHIQTESPVLSRFAVSLKVF